MAKLNALLELEKRGKLPEQFKGLLDEAKKRGLVQDHPISEVYTKAPDTEFAAKAKKGMEEHLKSKGKTLFETSPGEFAKKERQKALKSVVETVKPPTSLSEAGEQLKSGFEDVYTGIRSGSAHIYKQGANTIDLTFKILDSINGVMPQIEEGILHAPSQDKEIIQNYLTRSKEVRNKLEAAKGWFNKTAKEVAPKEEEIRPGIVSGVNRAIGEAIPTLEELAALSHVLGPTVAFGLLGVIDSADKDAKTMAIEGGKGALFGGSLSALGQLSRGSRTLMNSMMFGGQTAIEGGNTEQIATSLIVGAGFGILGQREGTTIRQAFKDRVLEAGIRRQQKEFHKRMEEELARPPLHPDAKVGDITRQFAVERLAVGDESVLPHVAKGIEVLGKEVIQDEIFNKAMGLAAKNKTLDKFKQIGPKLESMLGMKTPAEAVVARTINASGESAASVEAQNRLKSEQAEGISYGWVDTRSHAFTPISKTVDAVDMHPGPNKVKVKIDKFGATIIEHGKGAEGYSIHPKTKFPKAPEPVMGKIEKESPQKIAEDLNLIYNGKQEGYKDIPDYEVFTDKRTGATFYVQDATRENVVKKLKSKRAEFKVDTDDIVGKAKGPQEPPPNAPESPTFNENEPIRVETTVTGVSTIIGDVLKHLDLASRVGRYKMKDAIGIYKPFSEIIRTRFANDIRTSFHEIGHHLHKTLFGGKSGKFFPSEKFEPYEQELLAIASSPRTKNKAGYLAEGFAEFVMYYTLDPVQAKKLTPKFYDWFDATMSKDWPELHEVLLDARRKYQMYQKAPATAKLLSHVSIGEDPAKGTSSVRDGLKAIYTIAIDDLNALKNFSEMIKKNRELNYLDDPYILSRLYRGWMGKAENFLFNAPLEYHSMKPLKGEDGKPFKSLEQILEPIREDVDKFRAYAIAKRITEQAGKVKPFGTSKDRIKFPISKAEAERVIKEVENIKMQTALRELKEYQDTMLKYLADSGIIGAEQFSIIREAIHNYVPLYRVMDDWTGRPSKNIGRGFTNIFDPVKRQKAYSGRDIIDPLESIVKNTYAFINIAEKNRILNAFVDSARTTEGLGKFVDHIPTPVKPVPIGNEEFKRILEKYGKWRESTEFKETKKEFTKTVKGASGEDVLTGPMERLETIVRESLIARGMTEGEANVYIHKLKGAKNAVERNEVINTIIEKQVTAHTIMYWGLEDLPPVITDIFRPANVNQPNVIKVFKGGKVNYYEVDPEIYRGLAAIDKEASNLLVRLISMPAKMLRLGATTLSPEFGLRNPLRDQFMAFIQSKYGFVPVVDFTRGLFHALKRDEMYWDFKASGAEHSMLVSMDRKYLQSTLDDVLANNEMTTPFGMKSRMIKHPLETLMIFSEFGEMATRMGEFGRVKRHIDKWEPELKEKRSETEINLRAAFEAREVTLDFARMGAKGQAINSLVAFWNPRLQGLDKMVRTFKEDPVGATVRAMLAVTVPEVMLYYAQHDDPRYREIPAWQKDLFFVVITGPNVTMKQWERMNAEQKREITDKSTVWRIPKPFEIGVLFGALPRTIMEWGVEHDPEVFKEWAHDFAGSASPGWPIPTAIVPIMNTYANWDSFFDKPIVPKYAQDLAPEYQHSVYTSDLAIKIGRTIGYSPSKTEYLIRGYTGGFGGLAMRGVDKLFEVAGIAEPKPSPKDIEIFGHAIPFINEKTPGFRGFVARFPDANTKSLRRFYKEYEKTSEAARTFNALVKNGDAEAEAYYEKNQHIIDNSYAMEQMKNYFTDYQLLVREFYKADWLTPEERRKAIDEIYLEMTELAEQSLDYLKRGGRKSREVPILEATFGIEGKKISPFDNKILEEK